MVLLTSGRVCRRLSLESPISLEVGDFLFLLGLYKHFFYGKMGEVAIFSRGVLKM
jgi:hypothetical protein